MSSSAHDATKTPPHLLNILLKACALCGAVKSSRDGKACKKRARIWLDPEVQASWVVYYCSKGCQKKDWADHKARYKKANATAQQSDSQEALPGLPQDVVVTHILRSDTDPIVLARLRAVSRAMRDAVDATGIIVVKVGKEDTGQASVRGYLDTLKHLLRKGRLVKSEVCHPAARGGHLEVLQWARENGCPLDEKTCIMAAQGGHLKVLQWARARSCSRNATTCTFAAEEGHLEVLKWLRLNGCPWDQSACAAAAFKGNLDVLQ